MSLVKAEFKNSLFRFRVKLGYPSKPSRAVVGNKDRRVEISGYKLEKVPSRNSEISWRALL